MVEPPTIKIVCGCFDQDTFTKCSFRPELKLLLLYKMCNNLTVNYNSLSSSFPSVQALFSVMAGNLLSVRLTSVFKQSCTWSCLLSVMGSLSFLVCPNLSKQVSYLSRVSQAGKRAKTDQNLHTHNI